MNGSRNPKMAQITRQYTSRIPIPYGCLTIIVIILGVLVTLGASSIAIAIAILK
jgi:hypothetical protein